MGSDKAVIYMETDSRDPYYNLAFEEYVLTHRTKGDHLILWQNSNTIVIGRNQNAESEINRAFVEAHDIKVVRRETGGGAVYHDLGNLNYSFITDAGAAGKLDIHKFTLPVVKVLKDLGLNAEASGRNDILVNGRKVSGTAQRLYHGRILHHGTLLFDSDPEAVAGALNADPAKFQSKSSKSVKSRIGNIRDFLEKDMDILAFWAYLKESLAENGFVKERLTTDELKEVDDLMRSKYQTWEWNFGRSPKFNVTNKKRYNAGSIESRIEVKEGKITEAAFFGDFLSISPIRPLTDAMAGLPFRSSDIAAVLKLFDIEAMFGGITEEEILDLMFNT